MLIIQSKLKIGPVEFLRYPAHKEAFIIYSINFQDLL